MSDCRQEVFANKYGTTKAVVCSCGFATIYTVLSNDADAMGMAHFERRHEEHTRDLRVANAKVEARIAEVDKRVYAKELEHARSVLVPAAHAAGHREGLEEAAKVAAAYGHEGDRLAKEYACEVSDEITARIRALLATPAQPLTSGYIAEYHGETGPSCEVCGAMMVHNAGGWVCRAHTPAQPEEKP